VSGDRDAGQGRQLQSHNSGGEARQAVTASLTLKPLIDALFAWLISHQPVVLFSQNKSATSNQPAVLFSQNKSAPTISHQPTEQAVNQK
jgi:hypothetical protein